eukprot:CCRYP_002377-RH/>CCRYP_002377-RH protein AED:0.48 eAED:1.00 QI:0/0/0/1/0/0/2/0/91
MDATDINKPLGHHRGILPLVQLLLASVQLKPQKRKLVGSSYGNGDLVGSAESMVGRGVISGSMSLTLQVTPGQQKELGPHSECLPVRQYVS